MAPKWNITNFEFCGENSQFSKWDILIKLHTLWNNPVFLSKKPEHFWRIAKILISVRVIIYHNRKEVDLLFHCRTFLINLEESTLKIKFFAKTYTGTTVLVCSQKVPFWINLNFGAKRIRKDRIFAIFGTFKYFDNFWNKEKNELTQ